MKTSFFKVFAILTISVATLSATSSFACGGGGNKGGGFSVGYSNGNFGVRLGGGNGGYNNGGHNNNSGNCQNNGGYGNNGGQYFGQAYEPFHGTYICQPGDSFYTVSLKEYGNSANQYYIARFNGLAPNAALVPGQRLLLPSISAKGQLSLSNRPAGIGDTTPVQGATTTPATPDLTSAVNSITSNFANATKPAPSEPAPTKVTVGSTVALDSTGFGDAKGSARLRVGSLVLNLEVIEWSTSSTKVRLPQLELAGPTKAEIEVLRADGSLASKSAVELTPVTVDRLAQTN